MRRRGVTLAEVLTVIAILAVLAGIALPAFAGSRRRGDHAACADRLRQLGVGLTLYANDHDGWVPPATSVTGYFLGTGRAPDAEIEAQPAVLRAAMAPYVKSDAVWFCPADRWRGTDTVYLAQSHRLTSYWFVPMTEGARQVWPPRMQLSRGLLAFPTAGDTVPLIMDAAGSPQSDPDPRFNSDFCARSNHPDDLVNALRHDLSLSRRRAKFWTAGNDCP
ncbi:type II secretion system protein [bacterium]|nr:MAG: type II secretion system protein [bacterium]